MTEAFDPYYKWLGIPPEEQPPHYYRLLGIKPLETDVDVISYASDQRMAHLRSFSNGAQAALAQRLLNELAAARVCLLNPQTKATYDDTLKGQLKAAPPKAAARPSARGTDLAQGSAFGEYELLEKLSGGKSGAIWKARHRRMGRIVSLKMMPPDAAQHPELIKRFQREAKITANLQHPNLVSAFDAGEVDGIHYLVMEHVEGTDLATLVAQNGPLSVEQTVDYICQAARGFQFLHEHNVVHRNVKPGNLILGADGTVKISNMILARIDDAAEMPGDQGDGLTQQGQMMGTADYMPPEQAADAHAADHRSDIYALGCSMYHLLTGQPPYPGKSLMKKLVAHREQPIPSLRAVRPDVPELVDLVFQAMLAKNPADRFQSMNEVVDSLEAKPKPSLPLPLIIGIGAGIAVALVIIVVLLMSM